MSVGDVYKLIADVGILISPELKEKVATLSTKGEGLLCYKYSSLFTHAASDRLTVTQFKEGEEIRELFHLITAERPDQELNFLRAKVEELQLTHDKDRVRWRWNKKGSYTAKSAYRNMLTEAYTSTDLGNLWKIKVPLRIQIHLWLTRRGGVLTQDKLQRRGMVLVNRCHLCCASLETIEHLSGDCDFIASHWDLWRRGMNRETELPALISEAANTIYQKTGNMAVKRATTIFLFVIWRERCHRVFNEEQRSRAILIEEIESDLSLVKRMRIGEEDL
ncbi:hypothetical protein LUZ60_008136 [Juncus effusus]|nr:hypothetical protein LUZ60_008136 [Juncus effusus]